MRPRVAFGRFLIRLGNLIQSLSIMAMRPDDLIEFSRRTYARPNNVKGWADPDVIEQGLYPEELSLLERLHLKTGKLLVLGIGGGREAIPLAKMGFSVTGLDFVPEMVEMAKENAARQGIHIEGLVQEISRLDLPSDSFDVVWLSAAMYSCVPTRKKRLNMLARIRNALKSGGYFICQFHWDLKAVRSRRVEIIRKIFAIATLGNLSYEKGDMLWNNIEFIHAFLSREELLSEFKEGGFDVVDIHIPEGMIRGGAVLKS